MLQCVEYILDNSLVTSLCGHSGWLRARERAKPILWTHNAKHYIECTITDNSDVNSMSNSMFWVSSVCLFLYALVSHRFVFIHAQLHSSFLCLVLLSSRHSLSSLRYLLLSTPLLFFCLSLFSFCYQLYNSFYKEIKIRNSLFYFNTIYIIWHLGALFFKINWKTFVYPVFPNILPSQFFLIISFYVLFNFAFSRVHCDRVFRPCFLAHTFPLYLSFLSVYQTGFSSPRPAYQS